MLFGRWVIVYRQVHIYARQISSVDASKEPFTYKRQLWKIVTIESHYFLSCFLVVRCSIYKGDATKTFLEILCVNKKDWFSIFYGCYRACLQRRLYRIFLRVWGKHLSRRNGFFFVRELFVQHRKARRRQLSILERINLQCLGTKEVSETNQAYGS